MSCLYAVVVSASEFCNYVPHEGVYSQHNSINVMGKEYNMQLFKYIYFLVYI
jgi:uncharacterized membrane protein